MTTESQVQTPTRIRQSGEVFADCIEASLTRDTQEFQWEAFFRSWFRENGTPAFFLFKRHLGVTNLQVAELFSLVENHCVDALTGEPKRHLMFHTTEQIKQSLADALSALAESNSNDVSSHVLRFAERYSEVFSSTIAVDLFYCSCAIFIPPNLSVDLRRVCAEAGYVHSAGRSVFIRNIKKAVRKDLYSSLNEYLKESPPGMMPVPFVVYAHEDFSPYDRDSREQTAQGIEHTKLFLEKMEMRGSRLAQVIDDMRSEFVGKLEVSPPGPYDAAPGPGQNRTLWLICNNSYSDENVATPGNDRYYICYEQTAKNESPFFLFDENKPAWKSHTTMPHSLAAALINITRPHPPSATLCDPFGGTGTTWFEAKRLAPNTSIQCSDLSPFCPLLVEDNLAFFLMTAGELANLHDTLAAVNEWLRAGNPGARVDPEQPEFDFGADGGDALPEDSYIAAVRLLTELKANQPGQDQEFCISEQFANKLSALPPLTRYLFYAALRAELRFQGGYRRKALSFEKAFCKSLDELLAQIKQFSELRGRLAGAVALGGETYATYQNRYSVATVPALLFQRIGEFRQDLATEILVRDACDLQPASADVIICDPPYGFNTSEDQSQLAGLYSRFLESALMALRPNGHFVICLPAESKTGRHLPYCTNSGLVTNQILAKGEALGRDLYMPARALPSKKLQAPYYWQSERALRRVILHFRVGREGC